MGSIFSKWLEHTHHSIIWPLTACWSRRSRRTPSISSDSIWSSCAQRHNAPQGRSGTSSCRCLLTWHQSSCKCHCKLFFKGFRCFTSAHFSSIYDELKKLGELWLWDAGCGFATFPYLLSRVVKQSMYRPPFRPRWRNSLRTGWVGGSPTVTVRFFSWPKSSNGDSISIFCIFNHFNLSFHPTFFIISVFFVLSSLGLSVQRCLASFQDCARNVDHVSELRRMQLSVAHQKAKTQIQERLERCKMKASQLAAGSQVSFFSSEFVMLIWIQCFFDVTWLQYHYICCNYFLRFLVPFDVPS